MPYTNQRLCEQLLMQGSLAVEWTKRVYDGLRWQIAEREAAVREYREAMIRNELSAVRGLLIAIEKTLDQLNDPKPNTVYDG